MMLLLDLGNTRLKWAWLRNGNDLDHGGTVAHQGVEPGDVAEQIRIEGVCPVRILLASVAAPAYAADLEDTLQVLYGVAVERVETAGYGCGVRNGYLRPQQLGVDRWLALIAAHSLEPGPSCVIDAGSAVTVDGLAEDGSHAGGLIFPGRRLMHAALGHGTHAIGDGYETGSRPHSGTVPFARNTDEGVELGILTAIAAAIDHACDSYARQLGLPVARLLTGGDARWLQPALQGSYRVVPDLVLQGMALLTRSD